jgi:hypothetical protein
VYGIDPIHVKGNVALSILWQRSKSRSNPEIEIEPMARRITIRDIAHLAGVSLSPQDHEQSLHIQLLTRLVIRDSCGAVRKGIFPYTKQLEQQIS